MMRVLMCCAVVLVGLIGCETLPPITGTPGYADMIGPVTSPFYFESPLIQDEVRPIFMFHQSPQTGSFGGSDVRIYALQARVMMDEGDTSLVFNKFGLYQIDSDVAAVDDDTGWADFGVGIKHSLIRDPENGFIFTVGLGYEHDQGSTGVLQGKGEGLWNPYVSTAKTLGPVNLVVSTGTLLPISDSRQSSIWHYHLHVDTAITPDIYPFVEFNGYTVFNDGNRPFPDESEGGDLFNFGSAGSDGEDLITAAPGLRYRTDMGDLGLAFEFPITNGSEFFDWRMTFDFSIQF